MENDGFWTPMNKILAPDVGGGEPSPFHFRCEPLVEIQIGIETRNIIKWNLGNGEWKMKVKCEWESLQGFWKKRYHEVKRVGVKGGGERRARTR